ncbi:MAG TPA: polynucleotide adenylyltransferase, partial [Verrucomicrobiae bacterium]|nr:polynucleotide adenylyltransferase [Verrucomicrobiae bacterium]
GELVGADLARDMLSRLRFSGETVETVEQLVRQHMYVADPELSDAALRRFVRRVGPQRLERQFALRAGDIAGSGLPKRDDSNERFQERISAEVARRPAFSVADLAIGGDDVIAAMIARALAPIGYRGDGRVGAALHWLFEQVTDEPGRNDRDSLLRLLETYLDAHAGAVSP